MVEATLPSSPQTLELSQQVVPEKRSYMEQ